MSLILIDPGHGGNDPGASEGYSHLEKDYNLAISLELHDVLAHHMGYHMALTRATDRNLALPARITLERKLNPVCFVSIHQNSSPQPARGAETLFYPTSNKGLALAKYILDEFEQDEFPIRTVVPRSDLYVLSQTKSPAIIVECGFLNDKHYLELLGYPDGPTNIAWCIARGIKTWLSWHQA